ncbi:CHAPERONE PROTEIN CLPD CHLOROPLASTIC [Salix koriyanagi]|uniref:CHAPERONE PROTEIN CLPD CHLOROPLASTIC n=1 Tax=Salix koriyanagi TaxID=2511006 RepID=A0A9Q1A5R6_9ROSI|nr:CHAPERONE PROTEIN CLPD CHLOROPLASTIC [Salix koriyanagi]
MRSGACTVQQTLTAEAASVLKHSLSLARRRGHAQATPLHVAATLLSSRTSLLRRACLKSQPHQTSHPLQCRALELCFNVALNRLPTTPGPLLHGQPSLSNALIAALKRAQAHQRRGCIEQQQQQPLLTIKVELEQLIVSILDDPSVSRVMREAGFSSTAVKNNIEDSSASSVFQCYSTSGGVFSSPCSPSATETQREVINPATFWQTQFLTYTSEQNPALFSAQKKVSSNYFTDSGSVKEDIKLVLEVLLRKKGKNVVIVGDCVSVTEGLIGELMGRLERGEVPMELKKTQLIKFQFAPVSLKFMKKQDVEMNLSELKRKVDSLCESGAIIYTGDLKWTVEEFFVNGEVSAYNPVDHLVREIGRLLSEYSSSNSKVCLMATASYQTYMKCQMRQPSLETHWALQAVPVPSGGLGLSLHASSIHDSRIKFSHNPSQVLETKPFINDGKEEEDRFTCCPECNSNYEKEVQSLKSEQQKLLPLWLQPQGTKSIQKDEIVELGRKWNRLCHSLHHQGRQSNLNSTLSSNQSLLGKNFSFASSYPWWPSQNSFFPDSNSISFGDSALKPNYTSSCVPKFRRQQSCHIEFNFVNDTQKNEPGEPNLDSLKNTVGKEVKITLALGNSLISDIGKLEKGRSDHLCKLLKENVPWQSEIIPSIVDALVESKPIEKDTWLLIQGNDTLGKRRLALAIAESVLGSADLLLHLNMRKRDSEVTSYSEMLAQALRNQEKLVVFVEDVDLAGTRFLKFLADGFETGKFGESSNRRRGNASQVIFILTRGDCIIYEDRKMMDDSVIQMTLKVNEIRAASFGTPGIDHKRKAEWEISGKSKSPRVNEKENASCFPDENGNKKKDFSRQSSFNTLDLNLKADEDDESEGKPGEFSPMSSDLTRETSSDLLSPKGLLDMIKNRFVFDRNQAHDREMTEVLSSKFKRNVNEVFGGQNGVYFSIEERVLGEVLEGSGSFVNSQFEKWLKGIFQTSLKTAKLGGKEEGIGVRLCFGFTSDRVFEDGFMGTCLPRKIQVSFMD